MDADNRPKAGLHTLRTFLAFFTRQSLP